MTNVIRQALTTADTAVLPPVTKNTGNRLSRLAIAALLPLLLAGCYDNVKPSVSLAGLEAPTTYVHQQEGQWTDLSKVPVTANGEWWTLFNDSQLTALVKQASEQNYNVQVAQARLRQASALLISRKADQNVQVNGQAGVGRSYSEQTDTSEQSLGVNLNYTLDLFGKLGLATQGATDDVKASQAQLRYAQLLTSTSVASTYLQIRFLDKERAIVHSTISAYEDTLALTRQRFSFGDVTALDVARVQAEISETRTEALGLDRQRALLVNALAVLTGQVATSFSLPSTEWSAPLPVIPAGVPSTLLARRPDVQAASYTVEAEQARFGLSKKAWFPDINLTAQGGYAAPSLSDVFAWSARAWGIGALLSLPIFDGGKREAGVEQAAGQLDIALAGYRNAVLGAFRDVEDQLSELSLLSEQAKSEAQAVESASTATRLSVDRYRDGFISQLDLLDARRSELRNRRSQVQISSQQYQATVALIQAIGGDWSAPAKVTENASAAMPAQADSTSKTTM